MIVRVHIGAKLAIDIFRNRRYNLEIKNMALTEKKTGNRPREACIAESRLR